MSEGKAIKQGAMDFDLRAAERAGHAEKGNSREAVLYEIAKAARSAAANVVYWEKVFAAVPEGLDPEVYALIWGGVLQRR